MKIIFKPLFQKYLLYCFKNSIIVGIIIFIEQMSIFLSLLASLMGLFDSYVNDDIKNFFDTISKFSPLNFVKNSLNCQTGIISNTDICSASNLLLSLEVVITSIILIFLGSFVVQEILQNYRSEDNTADKLNEKHSSGNWFLNALTYCFINFLDFVIHFCSLGIFYLNFNEILAFVNLLKNSNLSTMVTSGVTNSIGISNGINLFLCLSFLAFYFFIYLSFVQNINLIIQYNKELSTHYDHIFSLKYDLNNFLLKILISLEFAFETNKIISDKSLLFLKIAILFVFCVFNLYLIYCNLLAQKILYLANHKYNIFRIFLNYFSFSNIIFILIFNRIFFQNFYVLYLSLFISLVIASFLAGVTNEKNYVAIYSTDNYILQLIYILNVKYNATDREVKTEVSNIMFHHKNFCIYHKNCQICKIENFDFDNFLYSFYYRTKELLKNKSIAYSNFEKYDINTFDIIKLLIIENLDKNKIIKLIYKARRILEKYEVRKRYDNNYFNILIYNNYMKRLITKNQVLKFKIIQCYEDTSLHITEALAIIETMLLSLNNGEKHLFGKSSDLYNLKDKISKNVLFLSYYQNYFVDTYTIIIYRFIYKNLFNCDINDYVTIYNFDEIKDMINYMFNNEKLIQIKLNFNNNSMKLLRLGKDLIQYRNKSFDDLIPIDFREHCCQELIKKVKSSDNEENKSFEYIIIDSQNNLKSLKINFTILASFKLDEVILIGQYKIVEENLILLKKNYSSLNSVAAFNDNENNDNQDSYEKNKAESTGIVEAASKINKLTESSSLNDKLDIQTLTNNNNLSMDNNVNNNINKKMSKKKTSVKKYSKADKADETNITIKQKKTQKKKFITDNESNENDNVKNSKNKEYINSKKKKNQKRFSSKDFKEKENVYNSKNFFQIFKRVDKTNNYARKFSNGFKANDVEIVYFSSNLQSAFFIKSNWLTKIKKKYSLPFADIFENIKTNFCRTQEEREKEIKISICAINYDKYFLIYQRMVNFVEEEMNNEEIRENLKRFRVISKNNKKSYYKLEFLYEIKIEKNEILYLLFKIKQIKNDDYEMQYINKENHQGEIPNITTSNDNYYIENNELGVIQESTYEAERINNLFKEKENYSVSNSSNALSNMSKQELMMSQDSSRKTISNNDQRMSKFTVFSLVFCIFLVFYCLFFLAMGIVNNNNIRKLYLIRNGFNDFRYFFYHTSMNFYFNLGINKNNAGYEDAPDLSKNNTITNKNIESLFFQKFQDNKDITINISKYVVEELSVKLNMLRTIYVNLQNAIYSSHYKNSLDGIFNLKTKFLQINKISNEISISSTEMLFFETINIFFNHGKVIVDNISSNNNYIYLSIINAKNNKIEFGDQNGSPTMLLNVQIKMYEIILNYITYYKNFINIGELMNKFFSDSLTDVFNSTYTLSFILMGIHLFLFMGGIFIVQFLHKIISQNNQMLCSSNDEGNIKFMREKLKSIKNMSLLFVENPRNLVITISKKRADFMKKLYENHESKQGFGKNTKNKSSHFNAYHDKNSSHINDEKKNLFTSTEESAYEDSNLNDKNKVSYFDKFLILIPFVQLVFILFILYYVYSLIFYFVFRGSYSDFILTSDFSNQNTDLDNKMMNNINLLSTMMLLNKTEYDVSYDLKGKENKIMMELLTNILQIRIDITKYKNTNDKFKSIDDFEASLMNCTYIYTNLNDSIFYDLDNNGDFSGTLIKSLKNICESFPFMKTGRLDSIFDEISYNSLHLYNLYDNSNKSYTDIVNIYGNFMFYDVFLMFIFIFRPIRKFSTDFIYNNIIMTSSSNYFIFTILYLLLNILVDLLIFYIINRMVVKKISDINKHLNNMITCISFKFSNNKEKGD